MKDETHSPMRVAALAAILTTMLFCATASMAQMRPGAKVEKTYGLGLPRDMDKLLIDDREYPDYPLKPGQEAYQDVDGYRIKDSIKCRTANQRRRLDDAGQAAARLFDLFGQYRARGWHRKI